MDDSIRKTMTKKPRLFAVLSLMVTNSSWIAAVQTITQENTGIIYAPILESDGLDYTEDTFLSLLDDMGVLVNAGVSPPFAVPTLKACTDLCSGSISAVSYSKDNQCVTSSCGYLKTIPNALWTTYTCVQPRNAMCNPRPKFEWLMTDACGNANTGWYMPGLLLTPRNATAVYNASYSTAISSVLGNAITYPGALNYFSRTEPSNALLNFQQPWTFFGAFIVSTSSSNLSIIEFGNYTNGEYYYGPQFWVISNSLQFSIVQPIRNGQTYCYGSFPINILVNLPNYAALSYDPTSSKFTIYLNGLIIATKLCSTALTQYFPNVILTGGRPSSTLGGTDAFGSANGSVYCLKIFEANLSSAQIQALSYDCTTPRFYI